MTVIYHYLSTKETFTLKQEHAIITQVQIGFHQFGNF